MEELKMYKSKLENCISLKEAADRYIAEKLYLEFYLDNKELGYTGKELWVIKNYELNFIEFIATKHGLGGKDVTTLQNVAHTNYKLNADRYNIENFEIYSTGITSILSDAYANILNSEDKNFWEEVIKKCLELNHYLCYYINECLNNK